MKQKKSVKDDFAETCGSVASGIISIALFVLLFIFPLILHNSYFDILETKYQCYYSERDCYAGSAGGGRSGYAAD